MSSTFAAGLFGAAAVLAVVGFAQPDRLPRWVGRGAFVLLLALALFLGQRDAIRANFQLWNPDESQLLAGALTLQERSVFWRDVDGATYGPFAQYPLLLPALVGSRIDYTSARLVAAVGTILLLVCLHLCLAARCAKGTARLLVLPAWAYFIFNQDPEIAQYNTELVPCLLLALAIALRAGVLASRSSAWACAAGAAAAAAPLGKLQAAPLAAWILLWLAVDLFKTNRRHVIALVLGAAAPWALFVGLATIHGAFADFRIRFLESNLGYVTAGATFFNDAAPMPAMLFGFSQFLWPVALAILVGVVLVVSQRVRLDGRELVFVTGLVAAAGVAIYAPNKPFAHYFLFAIGPLVLVLGAVGGPALDALTKTLNPRPRAAAAAAVIGLLAGFSISHHFQHPAYFRAILRTRPPVARDLIEAVQQRIAPGEHLAVWGWQSALYVMTQTVAVTPDLNVFWQVVPSPHRDFYRSRYLRDFAARPPHVFVDTTGPADFFFHDAEGSRHENFPELAARIAHDYVLDATIAGARIYVRRADHSGEARPLP